MTATEITVLITAITTEVGSLIGAFVLWRKSRHEANKIQISTETKPKLPPELRAYFELKKGVKNEN